MTRSIVAPAGIDLTPPGFFFFVRLQQIDLAFLIDGFVSSPMQKKMWIAICLAILILILVISLVTAFGT